MNLKSETFKLLDGKYQIERELGRGGMGAVYLATHLGTERAVAVKIIAPEFMRRAEFVERFRREARAAGRLRHPNVVDVTDFGIAETGNGQIAYLVMEYLDGCTLGEVLEEEKNLPLSWTLDILEQTCAAVAEAHRQGIIHRDLKPDNIWLEPNARGNYTVKVLDFGIAKLEEEVQSPKPEVQTQEISYEIESRKTMAMDAENSPTVNGDHATLVLLDESKTAILSNYQKSENETIALAVSDQATQIDNQTALMTENFGGNTTNNQISSHETSALTRVGAVLGTPLYMSPEQCRGEKLDARADIYSLGVIAYQMLSGATPFSGKYTEVMRSHKEDAAPPLEVRKVPRAVKRVVASALNKNPDERPPTALAFASEMRSHSEGIADLLRRSLVIWSEHLGTFLALSAILSIPTGLWWVILTTVEILALNEVVTPSFSRASAVFFGVTSPLLSIFFASILIGMTTWIVAQQLAAPLRPVSLNSAFREARKHLKTFGGTVLLVSLVVIPLIFLGVGLYLSFRYALMTPVAMMENLRGKAMLKRSAQLVHRSWKTVAAVTFLHFVVPLFLMIAIALVVALVFNGVEDKRAAAPTTAATATENVETNIRLDGKGVTVERETQSPKVEETPEQKSRRLVSRQIQETIVRFTQFFLNILIFSFSSVVTALLYLKTRQAGGESLPELLKQFENENDAPQSNWQRRSQKRHAQSGRHTSRNT